MCFSARGGTPSSRLQASSPDLSAGLDFRKPDRIRQFRALSGIVPDHLFCKLRNSDSFYGCGDSHRLVILFLHHGRPGHMLSGMSGFRYM